MLAEYSHISALIQPQALIAAVHERYRAARRWAAYTEKMKQETERLGRTRSPNRPDEQPIQRVVGKRIAPPLGRLPSVAARAAMDANARYRTRTPKGIFFYDSHEQMTRDRERWTVELMRVRRARRAGPDPSA